VSSKLTLIKRHTMSCTSISCTQRLLQLPVEEVDSILDD